jgi:hypothetical protein
MNAFTSASALPCRGHSFSAPGPRDYPYCGIAAASAWVTLDHFEEMSAAETWFEPVILSSKLFLVSGVSRPSRGLLYELS